MECKCGTEEELVCTSCLTREYKEKLDSAYNEIQRIRDCIEELSVGAIPTGWTLPFYVWISELCIERLSRAEHKLRESQLEVARLREQLSSSAKGQVGQ